MTENVAEATLVLLLSVCLLSGQLRIRRRALDNALSKPDPEKWLLLGLTMLTMAFVPLLDALAPLFEFADFHFSDEVAWFGFAFGCAAVMLLWRTRKDLARYHAATLTGRQQMPELGVYRYMRHPFYTAMLLWSVAQLLMLQNWLAGPAAGLSFLLVYLLRMPCEEEAQLQRFGHHYLDYMERTGRLLPRLDQLYRRPDR